MDTNDMDFFHQATVRICRSLDIDKMIGDCVAYLKNFMPINGAFMNFYDPVTNMIRNVTGVSDMEGNRILAPFPLSEELQRMIEDAPATVKIENRANDHPLGRSFKPFIEAETYSSLVLRLPIRENIKGVMALIANGHDRYSPEHARLLKLINDPLRLALSNTLKHQEVLRLQELLVDDNRYLKQEIQQMRGDEIIGANFGLRDVMEMVRQVAPLSSQVLLLGETGVGKEVIANAVHYSSPRREGPFIKVNCGAIPENLIDSELFGHEKGAFTGAISRKRGRFERAHQGTIFLDEIGELPPQAQIRLLRVIQNREIERVGGDKPFPVDIRIITATHRNLEEMVQEGSFREDLWFRINVFPITIPPLRRRTSDIPALVNHFIERKSRELNLVRHPVKAPGAVERLQSYHWPGNVRELENLVERALIKNRSAPINTPLTFGELMATDRNGAPPVVPKATEVPLNLDEAMRRHIQMVLETTGGRVQGEKGAAALLGTNPSTLRNRMKKLGIPYGRKKD
ncbi:MAG: AAA family ATPase [Proteobacteria bacterium]|nr:AAA family ATPase [Pseudomonadota bacterium]